MQYTNELTKKHTISNKNLATFTPCKRSCWHTGREFKEPYKGCDLLKLNIEYIGQQERIGKFPLDTFNDLETKSTFLRCEGETVIDARDRSREGYSK